MEAKIIAKEKEEIKEVKKDEVKVVSVVTETQEMIQVGDVTMNLNQYLVWLGNKLLDVSKAIVGK